MNPVIAILGTTGVGKSNLAIDIALRIAKGSLGYPYKGARIINADAMQVYSGMDVITNKVPDSEQQGVEHLLMGFKQPGEQYVVGEWVQDAMNLIDETHRSQKVPIVVGGTSYWIQHLLFPNRLSSNHGVTAPSSGALSDSLQASLRSLPPELLSLFENLPNETPSASVNPDLAFSLHSLLSVLDPPVAQRWHWKDTRKILRNLMIIRESGRLPSEIIQEQAEETVSSRYNTLCFWIYANRSELEPRLDNRVNLMVQRGLMDEIKALRELSQSACPDSETDFSLGIYQSIGYKEFDDYLSSADPTEAQFQASLAEMKLATRRYAKRQISWIRNKFLPIVYAADTSKQKCIAYLLNATRLNDWIEQVRDKGFEITERFLSNDVLPDPLSASESAREMLTVKNKPTDPTDVLQARRRIICPHCTTDPSKPVTLEHGAEWKAHERTKAHKRLAFKNSSEGRERQRQIQQFIDERATR